MLRECSHRHFRLFARGLLLSDKTVLPPSLKGFLQQRGAIMMDDSFTMDDNDSQTLGTLEAQIQPMSMSMS